MSDRSNRRADRERTLTRKAQRVVKFSARVVAVSVTR